MESLKVMEKINSIEQLDALGVKICEMLQVGIDKASIVVPETLQQIVAWVLYKNVATSIMLIAVIWALTPITISLFKNFIPKFEKADDFDSSLFIQSMGIITFSSVLLASSVCLITESIPCFIKALVAPNLVIIEQLGGLVK